MTDLFSQPGLTDAVAPASSALPPIPAKRYFTIGEVSDLCGVKSHVLRYWEQEFTQLKPLKRRGNRRYYQHHEVLLVRRIRELLYDQGYTIHGARIQLSHPTGNGSANGHGPANGPMAASLAAAQNTSSGVPGDLKAKLQDVIDLLKP
ncbi:MAG: MerR family transcriptional regulator [Rhodocyclaceae bacterium]|nr:MerR family transcriptional regulator [Rhodocyclaceae bacterium]